MLTEYSIVAYALIQQEEYHKALQLLSQNEELLEAVTTQGGTVDLDFIILTVHNSAYCYMKYSLNRLGMFEECVSYMDACIYNSESKKLLGPDMTGPQSHLANLKKEKYEAAIHLHYSALLSQMNKHEDSLKHAQTSFKKALLCMKICHQLCLDHLRRHNKLITTDSIRKRMLKQNQYKLIESPHYQKFHRLVSLSLPLLQYFHNKYHSTSSKPVKLNLKKYIANFFIEDEWILSATIDEIIILKPLDPMNMNNILGIQAEISKENMVNKLVLVVVAMFSIASELKFSPSQKDEAKAWHKRTVQSASELLPKTSMIVKQLKESFAKEHKQKDLLPKKARHNTFSSRIRTPLPPNYPRPWSRQKSNYERLWEASRIVNKSPPVGKYGQIVMHEHKTSSTPQPRPGTSLGNERKRSKVDSEDYKNADFNISSYDLY